MAINPLADIIIYSHGITYGLLGATKVGLEYLRGRYGSLAYGTTAAISGTDKFIGGEFAAMDAAGLQTMTLG